ncbi:MAG: ribose-5-phosphate isomerase RpiA [Melioribacteraceae bacterium]|nr:ribose-5-phosphate isomerase RpiA [Melioribacteraceae bacterium]MCF8263829.1 ribose-5-phosphate isomerase RpiA [Melioribacteraceae bacterium]MCF8412510.1 ribose-5-phosphate isomerase RpiA [Melioribacteraceae bacterium]
MTNQQDKLKKRAALKAVEKIKSGMVVGLGTGTTARHAIVAIAELIQKGTLKNILGIPTSNESYNLAKELGILLTDFDKNPYVDLTIDGADEVDDDLNLIKGGHGALLREKVVAQASAENIIIVDESKISKLLGEKHKVPVEVLQFASNLEKKYLESLGAMVTLRKDSSGANFVTDEGNYILDCDFGIIKSPDEVNSKINTRAGIVENGIFYQLATEVIVATESGSKILKK